MSSKGSFGSGAGRRRNDLGVPRDRETIVGYGPRSTEQRIYRFRGSNTAWLPGRVPTSQLIGMPPDPTPDLTYQLLPPTSPHPRQTIHSRALPSRITIDSSHIRPPLPIILQLVPLRAFQTSPGGRSPPFRRAGGWIQDIVDEWVYHLHCLFQQFRESLEEV